MLLARIVRNLVSNALRHAGSGGAALLGARPRGDRIVIEVRDTGPGIPQESQREIFEAFRQLGRSRTEGLGLGLSIVDGLARVLGHEVRLRSAPGHGSTFEVWLPRASSLAAPARSDVRPAASAALPHRVLLVEDDERVRTATRALLEGWSCETREASDLAGARRALEDGWRPDFVLADYHLENGEVGLTLLDALREQLGRAVPGAIITSDTSPELHESIRAAGLPVLRKPVRPARLRAVLAARDPARGSETGSVDR
jgi:CheY-like chemotaxis protein